MISACALLLVAVSHHLGNSVDYEEFHPAFGVACEHETIGHFSAGYFRNSQSDDTVWAAKRQYLETARTSHGRAFYEVGVALGYDGYPVLPLVRLGYDVMSRQRVGVELFALPGVEKVRGKTDVFLVIGAQLKVQ